MKRKNYSQLNYEQELARKERAEKKAAKAEGRSVSPKEPSHGFMRSILLPNLPNRLLNNLWFVLFSLPALFCIGAFLMVGGLIFIPGILLASMLMGAAMASLYHRCYEYTRHIPRLVREPFLAFFRREFRQGAVCGLVLGILWVLLRPEPDRNAASRLLHSCFLMPLSRQLLYHNCHGTGITI